MPVVVRLCLLAFTICVRSSMDSILFACLANTASDCWCECGASVKQITARQQLVATVISLLECVWLGCGLLQLLINIG